MSGPSEKQRQEGYPQLVKFTKGDPRINRKGRPKTIGMLREMAKEIVNQEIETKGPSKGRGKTRDIVKRTRLQLLMEDWANSASFSKQRTILELGYGKLDAEIPAESVDLGPFMLPSLSISPSFAGVYRDIAAHNFAEYVFRGGRGSTKSSFVSEAIIELIMNNPEWHALAMRTVQNTLRDSVYSQLVWAINYLGQTDAFKCTTSPLEITYLPTDQKIYFRGADDPLKIKSIKPKFGYINVLWFEELDQFRGSEAVRSIMQSAIRGGEMAYIFKSFNPPPTRNSWVIKELELPKSNRLIHESDYLSVPTEWLGQAFLDEAIYLKEVNEPAYDHEYLGITTATGGLVFDNLLLRKIPDELIATFERPLDGIDFGWYPDPVQFVKCHLDTGKQTLYIYDEFRGYKTSNLELYDTLTAQGLIPPDEMVIADSSEPKSIADLRSYGMAVRGAEKGPESITYSMKWLQSLRNIIIDPGRAPHTAGEFQDYELELDKDGYYITRYPDKNNHAIDAVRYATNLIWRRRGQ